MFLKKWKVIFNNKTNLKPFSNQVENLKSLGDAAFKHRQYHQAVAYYSEGIEVDPRDEELLGCRCAVYHKLSMFNEAVKDSERLISLVPGQAKVCSRPLLCRQQEMKLIGVLPRPWETLV